MTDFIIIRNFGIPRTIKYNKYPFTDLKVGDAFTVPEDDCVRVRAAAAYKNRSGDWKFVVRKQDNGRYAVVRVA